MAHLTTKIPVLFKTGLRFYSTMYFKMKTRFIHVRLRNKFCEKAIMCLPYILLQEFDPDGNRGGTVVKALCTKSEGRWFDSRWCHWNFSLT